MASLWADLLLNSEVGVLEAVCSRDAARAHSFARRFGGRHPYGSLGDMLAERAGELDCIYVATPLGSHAVAIESCLRAGVGVLTEKPATERAEEWVKLVELATTREVFLAEGMWTRCLPTFVQAQEWVEEGRIGVVRSIRADLQKAGPPSPAAQRTGVLMDYGVYPLYLACHFLGGAPERVDVRTGPDRGEVDKEWAIRAERDGATAIVNISTGFAGNTGASVTGELGAIEWGTPFNRTDRISLRRFEDGRVEDHRYRYLAEGFEHQLAEVTRSIRLGLPESPLLAHRMTLETLRLAERLRM